MIPLHHSRTTGIILGILEIFSYMILLQIISKVALFLDPSLSLSNPFLIPKLRVPKM
jgi:hypothetical protein